MPKVIWEQTALPPLVALPLTDSCHTQSKQQLRQFSLFHWQCHILLICYIVLQHSPQEL